MYPFKFDLDQSFIQICFEKKKPKWFFNPLNKFVLMKPK